jgi:hypothetical protein
MCPVSITVRESASAAGLLAGIGMAVGTTACLRQLRRREARCAEGEPRSRRRPGGKHLSADPRGTISNQEVAAVKAAGHKCLERINAEAPAAARLPPARTHQPQGAVSNRGTAIRKATHKAKEPTMRTLVNALARSGLLREDLDYHLLRASMVIIFLLFGYQ